MFNFVNMFITLEDGFWESKILVHKYFPNGFNEVTILHLWFLFIMYSFWLFLFLYKLYSQNDIFKLLRLLFCSFILLFFIPIIVSIFYLLIHFIITVFFSLCFCYLTYTSLQTHILSVYIFPIYNVLYVYFFFYQPFLVLQANRLPKCASHSSCRY